MLSAITLYTNEEVTMTPTDKLNILSQAQQTLEECANFFKQKAQTIAPVESENYKAVVNHYYGKSDTCYFRAEDLSDLAKALEEEFQL